MYGTLGPDREGVVLVVGGKGAGVVGCHGRHKCDDGVTFCMAKKVRPLLVAVGSSSSFFSVMALVWGMEDLHTEAK